MTEDVDLAGKLYLKKGTPFSIDMYNLHRDPSQWVEPNQFIPERFDPQSQYFLTPDGKKRHPMSYGPFLGGKRICVGKTFAEVMIKVVAPSLFGLYDFEFVDPIHYKEKTLYTL